MGRGGTHRKRESVRPLAPDPGSDLARMHTSASSRAAFSQRLQRPALGPGSAAASAACKEAALATRGRSPGSVLVHCAETLHRGELTCAVALRSRIPVHRTMHLRDQQPRPQELLSGSCNPGHGLLNTPTCFKSHSSTRQPGQAVQNHPFGHDGNGYSTTQTAAHIGGCARFPILS